MKLLVFNGVGGSDGDPWGSEELWTELLAHWMAAGRLADGQAVGGWCCLGRWLVTGTPGTEQTRS